MASSSVSTAIFKKGNAVALGCVMMGIVLGTVLVMAFVPPDIEPSSAYKRSASILSMTGLFMIGLYTTIRGTVEWIKEG